MASVRKRTWKNAKGPKSAWVVAYMHKGKQHLKTFATKREAVAWRAEMQTEVTQGGPYTSTRQHHGCRGW